MRYTDSVSHELLRLDSLHSRLSLGHFLLSSTFVVVAHRIADSFLPWGRKPQSLQPKRLHVDMAPQELVGRYERYKHGTRNLVYWLTKTAANCGDLKTALRSL